MDTACVRYLCFHLHVSTVQGNRFCFYREVGITQAEAKGIADLLLERIEITVPDIDILFVVFVLQITIYVAKFIAKGNILIAHGDGVCQLSGEVLFTRKHIGKCIAALFTALHKDHNSINTGNFVHEGHVNMASHIDDENHMIVCFRQDFKVFPFGVGDVVVTLFQLPVVTLARLTHENVDGGIGITLFNVRLRNQSSAGETIDKAVGQRNDLHGIRQSFDLLLHHVVIFLIGGSILRIIVVQPVLSSYFIACILQTILDIDAVALLHTAAAQTAFHGHTGTHAIEGNFSAL